jgi:hypothetical protein
MRAQRAQAACSTGLRSAHQEQREARKRARVLQPRDARLRLHEVDAALDQQVEDLDEAQDDVVHEELDLHPLAKHRPREDDLDDAVAQPLRDALRLACTEAAHE